MINMHATRNALSADPPISVYSTGDVRPPPQKKTYNPPNVCHIVCSKCFFSAGIVNYR